MLHHLALFYFVSLIPSTTLLIHEDVCLETSKSACDRTPFVPGYTLLATGFDIVTLKSSNAFLFNLRKYLRNNTCTVCQDTQNGTFWKLPRALDKWNSLDLCKRKIVGKALQSPFSVASEVASNVLNKWKYDLDLTYEAMPGSLAIAGSQSKMAEFAFQKHFSDRYTFLSYKMECAHYSFQMSSDHDLSPLFEKAIKQLPNVYNSKTKLQYQKLISAYGTHYITGALAGGRLQQVSAVRTCQLALSNTTKEEVMHNMVNSKCIRPRSQECANSLQQSLNDQFVEVLGGKAHFNLEGLYGGSNTEFTKWRNDIRRVPALLSYSLMPIHTLIYPASPKRENLRIAVSEYIKDKAMHLKCSYPSNTFFRCKEDCTCSCSPSEHLTVDCCPTRNGLARLIVEVKYAFGLENDFFTKPDGYVRFSYSGCEKYTHTVSDNNNPRWNTKLDFGIVNLASRKEYTLELWEQDSFSDDDLLIKCKGSVTAGTTNLKCDIGATKIYFNLLVTCLPHLSGKYCDDYIPLSP